jgi:hypothetical protein
MKKLFILLLFPIFSFSQITYKDVMSISSEKMFKKVMIENGYEWNSRDDEDGLIYGWEIEKDSINGNKSSKWGYYLDNGEFMVSFSRKSLLNNLLKLEEDNTENEYDLIVKEIKKNCKYYDIITNTNDDEELDYVCYSCSESKYKGKIGFRVSEGWGYIRHFLNN